MKFNADELRGETDGLVGVIFEPFDDILQARVTVYSLLTQYVGTRLHEMSANSTIRSLALSLTFGKPALIQDTLQCMIIPTFHLSCFFFRCKYIYLSRLFCVIFIEGHNS